MRWEKIILIAIVAILQISCFCEAQGNFTGHKLLGVFASDDKELEILQELSADPKIDFWNDPVTVYEKVNIRIPPDVAKDLEQKFLGEGIDFYVVTDDLQTWVDKERQENPPDTALAGRQRDFRLDMYHTFDAISAYIDTVGTRYSGIASVQTLGTTYEGNPIKGLKIGSNGYNKPVIWMDAGIHAREWVAPATAVYIINNLVNGYEKDPEITQLVNKFDWYIFPVVNPDGYKFTWTVNRMWRKNRSVGTRANFFCRGTDPNRNFDSMFGGASTSGDPCSEIYRGESAFSEIESRAIRDGVLALQNRLKAYFSIHAYSQLWMTPYGYTRDYPPHYSQQMNALRLAATAIQRRHGQAYRYGTIANTIYPATGSSVDWVHDKANVKYSFALELRDTGRQGFMLSNNFIIPNSEENWDGIKAVADLIAKEEGI